MTERDIKLSNYLESLELKAEHIFNDFQEFTDGARMLILLERKKDGGHNKEERRNIGTRFTFSSEEYKIALKDLLLMRVLYPETRLYASVNPRKLKSVIRKIEEQLLDCHYSNDAEKNLFAHKKIIKSPRHFFMQQNCADGSLFVIDVDDIDGRDAQGEALEECARLNIDILKTYKTKNGWHFITKPFNPNLWTHSSEVKKDALILLDY